MPAFNPDVVTTDDLEAEVTRFVEEVEKELRDARDSNARD